MCAADAVDKFDPIEGDVVHRRTQKFYRPDVDKISIFEVLTPSYWSRSKDAKPARLQ